MFVRNIYISIWCRIIIQYYIKRRTIFGLRVESFGVCAVTIRAHKTRKDISVHACFTTKKRRDIVIVGWISKRFQRSIWLAYSYIQMTTIQDICIARLFCIRAPASKRVDYTRSLMLYNRNYLRRKIGPNTCIRHVDIKCLKLRTSDDRWTIVSLGRYGQLPDEFNENNYSCESIVDNYWKCSFFRIRIFLDSG